MAKSPVQTVSPLMPRSPSNINATLSPSRGKPLAMRKSIARSEIEKKPPDKKLPKDYDMAEQVNEQISSKYVKGKKLGEGTYAVVYEAHLRSDPSKIFAIKKFKIQASQQAEGTNVDTIREIKYLQEIAHPSIIAVYDIFSSKDQNINMVMEYFPHGNMEELIKDTSINFSAADIKAWMGMLYRAIYYCHSNFILHRDIKPNNLLIAADGEVKLADFGLARSFAEPDRNMSRQVITLWYRPLELLFGAQHYSGAVDMWSIGMVFAEYLIRRPYAAADVTDPDQLATGGGEIAQIEKICQAVGTPSEDNWPGVTKLPLWNEPKIKTPLRDKSFFLGMFPLAGSVGIDLLMSMLKLDPRKRLTARESLQHAYWQADPRPTDAVKLPRRGGGATKMAQAEGKAPGQVVDTDKFKGVARKLEFGAK